MGENLTERPLLEGENLTVCAPLKVPARTRSGGEFHGPFDARIEDFFDFERSEINEDASEASIRVPLISKKYEYFYHFIFLAISAISIFFAKHAARF